MRLFSILSLICISTFVSNIAQGQHSIARDWNEEMLHAIRNDFARPTVHARNLWHTSIMMYDIWSVINDEKADTYLIGKTLKGFECPFDGLPDYAVSKAEATETAISYAVYRLMLQRFRFAPSGNYFRIKDRLDQLMISKGLNINYTSTNYQNGDPAAFGNWMAAEMLEFGNQDNSREATQYDNCCYEPVNDALVMKIEDENIMTDPNRWQPLTLDVVIDQAGNPLPINTPDFLSPEWGQVLSFSLTDEDLTVYNRDNFDYKVYHDPGPPPLVNLMEADQGTEEFLWGFSMVSIWGSHLDPADGVMIDISPGAIGNNPELPTTFAEYQEFYNYLEGGDNSTGHNINPATNRPYEPNIVSRADYGRVLAEFWADGPDSETPPGHWFTILNYVHDHPDFERKYRGQTEEIDELEWDIKAYFMLGGAMHDCAISAWGIKGWYDYLRPVSAIRAMAARGQSTIESLPNYHPAGIPLVDGLIEIVTSGDPLEGDNGENIGKFKLYTWRGPDFIDNEATDVAGVGWILAQNWWPYQRPSFVTPPFAGYVSGHSTYSRAAAQVLEYISGDAFFPGGMAEFSAAKNEFLVFEDGPSEDVVLQWATYIDASDQTSLSRIYGGIHPPADDIPGRKIGIEIAKDVIELAESIFFVDEDADGFYNYQDCDDNDASINPSMSETCDGIDNNCSGVIDEGLQLYTYYLDNDGDGYGDFAVPVDTCRSAPITGYVDNNEDCNDFDAEINPAMSETCDGVDNNCSGAIDEGLQLFTYYIDADGDGFGNPDIPVDTCRAAPIAGYVIDNTDCNDLDNEINSTIAEICDGIDNNCNGLADDGLPLNRYYQDFDGDGYGNLYNYLDTCLSVSPAGFVRDSLDCNDEDLLINPSVEDLPDNGIDEDCSGFDLYKESKVFPNPFRETVELHYDSENPITIRLFDMNGQLATRATTVLKANRMILNYSDLAAGIYYIQVVNENFEELYIEKLLKI